MRHDKLCPSAKKCDTMLTNNTYPSTKVRLTSDLLSLKGFYVFSLTYQGAIMAKLELQTFRILQNGELWMKSFKFLILKLLCIDRVPQTFYFCQTDGTFQSAGKIQMIYNQLELDFISISVSILILKAYKVSISLISFAFPTLTC